MPSAASSVAAEDSHWPADNAAAAQTRYGSALVQAPLVRHARELAGQGLAAPRLDDLADRQGVDDHAGGELPVTGLRGVPYRVGELAVPLIPPGRPPVQGGHPVRVLVPQLEPQHLGEQRVVAVPPAPDRLDKRVRPRDREQGPAGLLVAGQLAAASALTCSRMDVASRTSRTSGGAASSTSSTR